MTFSINYAKEISIPVVAKLKKRFTRIHRARWISFTFDLNSFVLAEKNIQNNLSIRLATEEDIERISSFPDSDEPIVESCLRFWKKYGFRKLYLGFLNNESEPAIFQYVLDDSDNDRYSLMEYGKMFQKQRPDSVQVENLYAVKSRRIKHLAVDFENLLFAMLKGMGKKTVRTHISIKNRPALIFARHAGFRPDCWITMTVFDIPLMRSKMHFLHSDIRDVEFEQSPLTLFRP